MKFETVTDIAAPQAFAFDRASDFAALADRARSYGAKVVKLDGDAEAWQVDFTFRGRPRRAVVTVMQMTPGGSYDVETVMDGLVAHVAVVVSSRAEKQSNLQVTTEISAQSLTGLLLLKSLGLAKGRLDQRYAKRVRHYADKIERDWQQGGQGSG
ncbi:MAG: hypothetical protein AAGF56_01865 [Pseudomonadota bacterium]